MAANIIYDAERDDYGRTMRIVLNPEVSGTAGVITTLPKAYRAANPAKAYMVTDWSRQAKWNDAPNGSSAVSYFPTLAAAKAFALTLGGAA